MLYTLGQRGNTITTMKLIHTADILLDACYAALSLPAAFGNRRRQGLREVLKAILARAAEWPADAVLIAGNLFEPERVTRDTIAFLQAEFDALRPLPVLIAPGNRDPYVPDSPYAAGTWSSNVHVFDRAAWQSHEFEETKLIVHGFSSRDLDGNPLDDLSVTKRDGWVQVALVHRRGLPPASPPGLNALDYLALGGLDTVTQVEGASETIAYYSGAPEGHNFDEAGPRHFLEVEVGENGVQVTPVLSSRVVFVTHTIDCAGFGTLEQVSAAVREKGVGNPKTKIPDPFQRQVARVTLTGTTDLAIDSAAIRDAVGPAFDTLLLVDATSPADDYEELARQNTCLGMFIRGLNEELEDAPDQPRRQFVARARDLGLAAYRGRQVAIPGLEGD